MFFFVEFFFYDFSKKKNKNKNLPKHRLTVVKCTNGIFYTETSPEIVNVNKRLNVFFFFNSTDPRPPCCPKSK